MDAPRASSRKRGDDATGRDGLANLAQRWGDAKDGGRVNDQAARGLGSGGLQSPRRLNSSLLMWRPKAHFDAGPKLAVGLTHREPS